MTNERFCLRTNDFSEQAGRPPCSLDPFFIMPDKCKCVDFQVLKLQELPDFIPQVKNNFHFQLDFRE